MKTKTFFAESADGLRRRLGNVLSADFRPGPAVVFASVFHDMGAWIPDQLKRG